MRYVFNPLTGQLEFVGDNVQAVSGKTYTTVDTDFLTPRTITLDGPPLMNSEFVFFNGLLIDDTCYTINTNELVFDSGIPLKIGDFIDIRYLI